MDQADLPGLDVSPFESSQVADVGDLALNPFSIDTAITEIESGLQQVLAQAGRVVSLGGDHTIALPILRVLHRRWGPIAVVHFDAHLDTWDTYFGAAITHGTPFRRASEEGLLARGSCMHLGIRGPLYDRLDLSNDSELGFGLLHVNDARSFHVPPTIGEDHDRRWRASVWPPTVAAFRAGLQVELLLNRSVGHLDEAEDRTPMSSAHPAIRFVAFVGSESPSFRKTGVVSMSSGSAGNAARRGASGQLTGRRIQDAALELFAGKGFYGTGIRDIADRVGVSTAALYHYMSSKDELLIEIMTSSMTQLIRVARECLDTAEEPVSELAALVRAHVVYHALDPLRSMVNDDELRVLSGEPRARVMDLRDSYELLWADTLDRGLRGGAFRFADSKITRLALLEMCNGVDRWYSGKGPMGPGEVADVFADLALAMVGARRNGEPAQLRDLPCIPAEQVLKIAERALREIGDIG